MRSVVQDIAGLLSDERGTTMVEYAVVVCAIAVACVGVVATIGAKALDLFSSATQIFP